MIMFNIDKMRALAALLSMINNSPINRFDGRRTDSLGRSVRSPTNIQ
jgi:hypothetical protein